MSRRVIAVLCAAAAFVVGVLLVTARGHRESRTNRAAIGPDTIVMLGDSLTEEGNWDELLPDWPIANRGYAGYTTAQLLDVAKEIAARRPRLIFILTGTNDIRDGLRASRTVEGLSAIIDGLRRDAPNTVIVLQTILPRADARSAVREANLAIRRLASEREVELLDLYSAFDDGSGALRAPETTDGIHLAAAGYERWAAEIDAALRTLAP